MCGFSPKTPKTHKAHKGISTYGTRSLKLEDVPRFEALYEGVRRALKDVESGGYRLGDLALVAVLAFTGCRLGEALKLRVGDVDPKSRAVRIAQGRKVAQHPRVVPVPSSLFWDVVGRYLTQVPGKDGLLFPLSESQARKAVYRFAERYLGRRVRPHALRHSYAVFMLERTKDLGAVRALLGHSSYSWVKAYATYARKGLGQELEEAFRELDVGDRR